MADFIVLQDFITDGGTVLKAASVLDDAHYDITALRNEGGQLIAATAALLALIPAFQAQRERMGRQFTITGAALDQLEQQISTGLSDLGASIVVGPTADIGVDTDPVPLDTIYYESTPGQFAIAANIIAVPITGIYLMSLACRGVFNNVNDQFFVQVNGVDRLLYRADAPSGAPTQGAGATLTLSLVAADAVRLRADAPGASDLFNGFTSSGQLGSKLSLTLLKAT